MAGFNQHLTAFKTHYIGIPDILGGQYLGLEHAVCIRQISPVVLCELVIALGGSEI